MIIFEGEKGRGPKMLEPIKRGFLVHFLIVSFSVFPFTHTYKNTPLSLYTLLSTLLASMSTNNSHSQFPNPDVVHYITALQNHDTREEALLLLSKTRSIRDDLAPLLWHSFGTIAILLQEISSVHRVLSTTRLTEKVSNRVCSALALLQVVATHPDTKTLFLKAKIPLYLHPFLNNSDTDKAHDNIRLTSLGIIGTLVKTENEQAMQFILKTNTFPCFLNCMDIGGELTKTVAAYILNKVLCNDDGLKYCCVLADRFYAIVRALGKMLDKLVDSGKLPEESSKRQLKYIIWCYYRLSQRERACAGFRYKLPTKLRDSCVINAIRDDTQALEPYLQLYQNVASAYIATPQLEGLNSRSSSHSLRLI